MANFVFCEIECEDILNKLINRGVVAPHTFNMLGREQHCDYVLDYSKCDPEEWEKQKESILEKGVISVGEERRDYTEEEIQNLCLYPLQIKTSEGTNYVGYFSKWVYNENPSYYISRALPDEIIKNRLFYEGRPDGSYCAKNGVACTLTGKKVFSIIRHLKNSMINDIDGQSDTVKVSIPWTNKFASIYVKKEDIQPYMFSSEEFSDVFLTKESFKVYQAGQLPSIISASDIKAISDDARETYLSTARRTPKQKQTVIEEPPEEEADYDLGGR